MNPILIELIKDIVVPEVSKFIQDYYNQNNKWPTKEEMEQHAISVADQIIKQGEEFLTKSDSITKG